MNTKKRNRVWTSDFKEILHEQLQDTATAAAYLTACLDEGPEIFLLAVRDVAEARGGISLLAKATSLNREGLYDMLSEDGNPRLSSVTTIMDALGLKVEFTAREPLKKAA